MLAGVRGPWPGTRFLERSPEGNRTGFATGRLRERRNACVMELDGPGNLRSLAGWVRGLPAHFVSANAYRCFSVRTYRVSSAIAGVAATRSPSGGFLVTTTGESAPAFSTVTAPSFRDVR